MLLSDDKFVRHGRILPKQEIRVQSLGQKDPLGEGNDNPLQYSCMENPMEKGAWQATLQGVAKSQTQLSDQACIVFVKIQGGGLFIIINVFHRIKYAKSQLSESRSKRK